jgi:small nuclear ribonucleoprotein
MQTFIGESFYSNRAYIINNGETLMAEMIEKVLERSIGLTVLIKVRGGRTLRGTLEGFDQHVNLVLKNAEEITGELESKSIGTIVLRGDNVIMISPPPE